MIEISRNNSIKLKDYLIEKNKFLLNKNNYGKVIMLSGAWGSGKTYFWHDSKDSIESKLKYKNKPNIYISLYGKSSLSSIENEVFVKAYNRSSGNYDDKQDVVEKLFSTFSSLSETVDQYADTKVKVTSIIKYIDDINKSTKKNKAKKLMEEGLIICFDDFERKSSEVNLNDLFGFITNLSLQYKATIVIILNDEVFEGKDKKIFANIKEKSVNKFLKFEPTSKELFNMVFSNYNIEEKNKSIILNAIDEMKVLNARIYKNILENLEEYLEKNKDMTDAEIRYFALTIINFNLNHIVFKFYDYPPTQETKILASNFYYFDISINILKEFIQNIEQLSKHGNSQLELIDFIKQGLESKYKTIEEPNKKIEKKPTEKLTEDLKKVDKYAEIIWFFWKLDIKLKYREDVSKESQSSINNFIETGIIDDI